MLIGLAGTIGSGKTTIADYLVLTKGFTKLSFATPLKNIVKICFELDDSNKVGIKGSKHEWLKENLDTVLSKVEKYFDCFGLILTDNDSTTIKDIVFNSDSVYRRLLQYIGTDVIRRQDESFFLKAMFGAISGSRRHNVIIDDVRFPNEAELVKQLGGIVVKLVTNDDVKSEHSSERHIDFIEADAVLFNDKSSIDKFVDSFLAITNLGG